MGGNVLKRYGLFGKFTVREEDRNALVEILLEAAASMNKLKECELYVVNIAQDDPCSVFVYEVWEDEEAHQNSLSLESTRTLIQRARPLLTGVERIATLSPTGGKGL